MLDDNNSVYHNYGDVYMQCIISTVTTNMGVLVPHLRPMFVDLLCIMTGIETVTGSENRALRI